VPWGVTAQHVVVGILDGNALPGAARIVEVGFHTELRVQSLMIATLSAVIEGRGAPGALGQGDRFTAQPVGSEFGVPES